MSANPHATGGSLLVDLEFSPDFRDATPLQCSAPGAVTAGSTRLKWVAFYAM